MEDPTIDAVVISLPHHLHMKVHQSAAAAGKHILMEKLIVRTPEEATAMIDVAEAAGVTLMVAHSDRYSAVFLKVKQFLTEQALRDIFAVQVNHYSNLDLPPDNWRWSKELTDGGCVIDTGAHQLDPARCWPST